MKATLAWLVAGLLALPARSVAAPPAAPPPADAALPLRAGDTVQFDLSGFPTRYEGAGKASCKGTVITAIGPEEQLCEQGYAFEVPPGGARLVYVFRAAKGGAERRVELPLTREPRPVEFRAPAEGLLLPPPPVAIPPEVADRAGKEGAVAACRRCRGSGFELQGFEVTQPPRPVEGTPSVRLRVTSTVSPAARAP